MVQTQETEFNNEETNNGKLEIVYKLHGIRATREVERFISKGIADKRKIPRCRTPHRGRCIRGGNDMAAVKDNLIEKWEAKVSKSGHLPRNQNQTYILQSDRLTHTILVDYL